MTCTLAPGQLSQVLLVSLNVPGHYSLALPLLKGYAQDDAEIRQQVAIRLLDIPISQDQERIRQRLLESIAASRPQVLGFSCNLWNAAIVQSACRWVRASFSNTLIVLGGQEICPPMDEIIHAFPEANVLVQGEGEGPFREFLKALLHHGWEGLFKVAGLHLPGPDGVWHWTGPAPRIANLASIPSAYLSGNLLPPRAARFGCLIEITRGCPHQCSFCVESERYRSAKSYPLSRVGEELRFLLSRGYRSFHFLDPILYHGGKLAAVHEVLAQFDLRDTSFFVELYAEHIRREDVPHLDFVTIGDLGLQTITEEASRIIRRPFRRERFLEGYHLLKEAGKRLNVHLLFGLPGDTYEGFLAGARFALELQPECVIFNRLSVLRGTPLRREAQRYGLRYDPTPPYSVRECSTFPAADIERARQLRDRVNRAFFPHVRYRD
jgi:radical SAM superfamily enzyme YgiQ (UPF0313 family)